MKIKLENKLKKLGYELAVKHSKSVHTYRKEYPTNEDEKYIILFIRVSEDKVLYAYINYFGGSIIYSYKDLRNIANAFETLANDLEKLKEHFDTLFALHFEKDFKK